MLGAFAYSCKQVDMQSFLTNTVVDIVARHISLYRKAVAEVEAHLRQTNEATVGLACRGGSGLCLVPGFRFLTRSGGVGAGSGGGRAPASWNVTWSGWRPIFSSWTKRTVPSAATINASWVGWPAPGYFLPGERREKLLVGRRSFPLARTHGRVHLDYVRDVAETLLNRVLPEADFRCTTFRYIIRVRLAVRRALLRFSCGVPTWPPFRSAPSVGDLGHLHPATFGRHGLHPHSEAAIQYLPPACSHPPCSAQQISDTDYINSFPACLIDDMVVTYPVLLDVIKYVFSDPLQRETAAPRSRAPAPEKRTSRPAV